MTQWHMLLVKMCLFSTWSTQKKPLSPICRRSGWWWWLMSMIDCDDDYIFSSFSVAHSRDDDGHLQHDPDGRHLLLCRQERVEGNSPGKHPALQVWQRLCPSNVADGWRIGWCCMVLCACYLTYSGAPQNKSNWRWKILLRPTRTVGVPRVWEKIEEGIKSKASSSGPRKLVGKL